MKSKSITQTTSILLGLAAPLCPSISRAASIVGDTIDIWSVAQSNGGETLKDTILVIDPGVEHTTSIIDDIYNLDFGPSTIVMTTLNPFYSPWFGGGNSPTAMEFRGIDVPGEPHLRIDSVFVRFGGTIEPEDGAPANYPDFSVSNVSFGDDFVRLETGPYQFGEGSFVAITMNFVPEPSTSLLAIGSTIPPLLRRKRRM